MDDLRARLAACEPVLWEEARSGRDADPDQMGSVLDSEVCGEAQQPLPLLAVVEEDRDIVQHVRHGETDPSGRDSGTTRGRRLAWRSITVDMPAVLPG